MADPAAPLIQLLARLVREDLERFPGPIQRDRPTGGDGPRLRLVKGTRRRRTEVA